MKVKIKIGVDIPVLLAIEEYLRNGKLSENSEKEIKFFLKKILRKTHEKVENLDSVVPDIKVLTSFDKNYEKGE